MTRERALELAERYWNGAYPAQNIAGVIADAILAAVAEEREACAKIAEELPKFLNAKFGMPPQADSKGVVLNRIGDLLASLIRERT